MTYFCLRCGKKGLKRFGERGRHYKCPRCGFIFHKNPVPAVAVIIERRGKILLTKRAIIPKRGYWDLPGGFCEWGEHPEETARREAKEELGIRIHPLGLVGVWKTAPRAYFYQGEYLSIVVFYYAAKITSGSPSARQELTEIRWFPLGRLPQKMAFANDRKALLAYKNSKFKMIQKSK